MRFFPLFLIATLVSHCKSVSSPVSHMRDTGGAQCPNWKQNQSTDLLCRNPFKTIASPVANPVEQAAPGFKEQECEYYLRVRGCLSDCNEYEKNRLLGYFQTCMGVSGLAVGDYNFVEGCRNNPEFSGYVVNMRYCLQETSRDFNTSSCHTCKQVLEGAGGSDEGIIGSHTPCNESSGFCKLSATSLRCFGAGLGSSWRGVFGSHSAQGSSRSVGFCHMLAQGSSCAANKKIGYDGFMGFWRALCGGYQKGCEAMQNATGSTLSNTLGGLFGDTTRQTTDILSCKLSCPLPEDINRVSIVGGIAVGYVFDHIVEALGRNGVLGVEAECRRMFGTL